MWRCRYYTELKYNDQSNHAKRVCLGYAVTSGNQAQLGLAELAMNIVKDKRVTFGIVCGGPRVNKKF